jgi:Putative zinc-finger
MMKRCLDEGLLQAYMDGELSPEHAGEAAAHVAACPACAEALAEAERESAFFATAFGTDDSMSVPSELLRSRIDAAVARLESTSETNDGRTRGWGFGGFLASLSGLFTFTPQGAVAFASLLAVVLLAGVYFAVRHEQTRGKAQGGQEVAQKAQGREQPTITAMPNEGEPARVATPETVTKEGRRLKPVYSSSRRTVPNKETRTPVVTPDSKEQLLPGEKEYQTAIASLEKTIKLGGDVTLKPSTRVEYERNLALLDSAISQTRSVAARDPKDRDAVGFLMSAYQSKVELLTQVAEQAQVAALGH